MRRMTKEMARVRRPKEEMTESCLELEMSNHRDILSVVEADKKDHHNCENHAQQQTETSSLKGDANEGPIDAF